MSKRSALGRGLGALIPPDSDLPSDSIFPDRDSLTPSPILGSVRHVPVEAILPNPHQPRQQIDPEALAELAASIVTHGMIQPLVVSIGAPDAELGSETGRPVRRGLGSVSGQSPYEMLAETQYTLIAGERRLRAAKQAGMDTVPVIVKEATPQEMLELALVENIQRADLNPLEEAAAYHTLTESFGLTQQQIADKVGKNRVSVANALRLLRLPDFCQSMLANGQISEGHARALLALEDDQEMMQRALKTVIRQHLNVRQTEELVRRLRTLPASPKATRTVAPETRALEKQFAQALGTKVSLSRSKKGGRLTIHFYSEEELQRLYDILTQTERDSS